MRRVLLVLSFIFFSFRFGDDADDVADRRLFFAREPTSIEAERAARGTRRRRRRRRRGTIERHLLPLILSSFLLSLLDVLYVMFSTGCCPVFSRLFTGFYLVSIGFT